MLDFIVKLYLLLMPFGSALIYIYIYIYIYLCFKYSKVHSATYFFCLFVSTGPLLNEDMSVGCMPHKQYKDLTFSLSGKELG